VVAKGGALAGYRWGLPRKAALLDNEAQHAGDFSRGQTRYDERALADAEIDTETTTKLDHAA
jgi:AraC family transcriptional regulator of adaptative response/methylated-DNA-[protein]-cysteine methyltransferase